MKILIVFTTITKGSSETYDGTWYCIKKTIGRRRMNVAINQEVIGQIYVFNGNKYSTNEIWNYESIVEGVNLIFKRYKDAQFLVLLHSDTAQMNELHEAIKNGLSEFDRFNFRMSEYSTTDRANTIWTDHVSGFCSDPKKIHDKFIALWNDLWRTDTLKTVQTLRYEILSPLVARDLIEQAIASNKVQSKEIPQSLRNDIAEAVKNLDSPINKFCMLASIKCDGFRKKLQELRNHCGASSGDQSWETFHDDLKDVAEQMEAQIEAIGG